jgi:type VI secretion system secreted protein Hcp
MAVDMFLDIEGIKGESKDDKYKGKIDVLAWSWGASNAGSSHMGGGSGAGKVNVQDLSVTKYIDAASADLYKACCNGQHFNKATLIVRKAGGTQLDYVELTMEQVMVTSVSTGGSGGEDRLTENVTLNFAKFKFKYTEQSEKGAGGAKPEMGWDISANKVY